VGALLGAQHRMQAKLEEEVLSPMRAWIKAFEQVGGCVCARGHRPIIINVLALTPCAHDVRLTTRRRRS
jgi:hypothetical protein